MHSYIVLFKSALDKGLFHLMGSNFLVQFLGFGLVLFLAGYLSPAEVGNLKLLHSYSAFFILLGCFGYNSSILKFCSENINKQEILSCFNHGMKRTVLFSLISFGVFTLFNLFYLTPLRPEINPWSFIYSFAVLFAPLGLLFLAYLQSLKKVKLAAKLQAYVRILFILLIFISAYLWGFPGVVISTVLSYFFGLLIYYPVIKTSVELKSTFENCTKVDKYSYYIFLGALVTVLSQNIDVYILDFMGLDSETIGVYSVATIFFLSATVITGTIQTVITPYFSNKQNDLKWVRSKAIFYQKRLVLFSILVCIALVIVSNLLVTFYFGDSYNRSIYISYFLIAKYFFWSCFCIQGAVLFSIGIVKEGIYVSILVLVSNIIFSLSLFPLYGVYGVALSQVISSILQLILVSLIFFNKTKAATNEIF